MKISWKTCFKLGVTALLLYICIFCLPQASKLVATFFAAISPLLFGCGFAYVLNIPMSFYERHYFPRSTKKLIVESRRPVCLVAAVLTVLAVISLVVGLMVPQIIDAINLFIEYLPKAIRIIISSLQMFDVLSPETINSLNAIDWKEQISKVSDVLTTGFTNVVDILFDTVVSVFSWIVSGLLSLIFAIYILAGKNKLGRHFGLLADRYLSERIKERTYFILNLLNDCFHRYFVGQITEALILGVLCLIGMLCLGIPYAPMISAFIAFTALIPIAGAYIGAAVGAIIILTVSPLKALVFIIFLILLQQFEGNLIYPRVVGSSIGLPGIWVLVSITVGGGLFGIVGMLLGVPVAAVLYRLVKLDVKKGKRHAPLSDTLKEGEDNA